MNNCSCKLAVLHLKLPKPQASFSLAPGIRETLCCISVGFSFKFAYPSRSSTPSLLFLWGSQLGNLFVYCIAVCVCGSLFFSFSTLGEALTGNQYQEIGIKFPRLVQSRQLFFLYHRFAKGGQG